MKNPALWNENDLLQLIANRQEEGFQLDFKRADALQQTDPKKREISKDVSAFANSAGGTIVYGIAESDDEPHLASDLSPIDTKAFSKESLDQVINSRIQPRIAGIIINPVELRTKDPGKFAYVVAIPESTTAHQASDKKYYRRFNFESVPMEDYEVRQTMNRASRPAYKIVLNPTSVNRRNTETKFRFQGILQNETEIVGHDVSAVLFVPRSLVHQPDKYTIDYFGVPYTRIVGDYVDSPPVMKPALESAHPLTPYTLEFGKSIHLRSDHLPKTPYTFLVKVFDQFGLSLTATFHLFSQTLVSELVDERHAAKRSPSSLLTRQLS